MTNSQRLFCKTTLRTLLFAAGLLLAVQANAGPFIHPSSQSQSFTLTGRVVNENGDGIPGATILVKGASRGVITDTRGAFSLEVSPADVLDVSYLGYSDQSVPVGNNRTIEIKMVSLASELDEVTVVAYGTQRKESIIGAISTLSTQQLNISTGQLSSSLQGKLPGIIVMQRTGEPGSPAEFWIRGMSTFGAYNKPLVLVDGIERDMDLVDTDDIATFSILKDATATALYGVRGANGIVVITTKRGTETKPKVNIKAEFGMTQPVKLPEMADTRQWLDYFDELTIDAGGSPRPEYDRQMYISGADQDIYPSVDWVKTIFKNMANTGRVNVNVTGGSKAVRYYVAGSYYTEAGIFNMANNDRYDAQMNFNKFNFRSNVDINITSSTELGLSISTQYTTKNMPGYGNSGSMDDLYNYTMLVTPIATPTVFSDGTIATPRVGHNPYNMLNNTGYRHSASLIAQSLMSLTQDFSEFVTPGLKANVKFSWDASNGNTLRRSISPTAYYTTGRDADGNLAYLSAGEGSNYMTLSTYNTSTTAINLEAMLTYEREFAEAHQVSGMFLYSMRNKTDNVPTNQTHPYIMAFPNRNMGIAGRLTYSYKYKYFFETNFGYNGSENFAPGKRFGFFPSVAVGYMISSEDFWNPIRNTVHLLKIRASHGKVGNDQIGGNNRFAYNSTINTTTAPGFIFGTNPASIGGLSTLQFGNPNVGWEESTKSDVGLELGLFNMIRFTADYFNELREGIFIPRRSTPSVSGVNTDQYVNVGRMRNRGFDMSLEFDRQINKDLFISARGNFTYNRTVKLYDDMPDQIWKYQNEVNFANNQQRGLIADGLFADDDDIEGWYRQSFSSVRPGDIKYKDINGDGIINTFDRVAIGYTTVPEINYGFGVSVGWKDFDLSLFFAGVGHVTRIISGANLFGASDNIERMGQIYADVAENRWTLSNQNPDAPYPRLSMTKVENNMEASTYWLRDMSFLRLKNAEIGYTLPSRISEKAGMSKLRIYIQGVNLLTFSKFKLWDPELDANYGNKYPNMRTATVGLNINF